MSTILVGQLLYISKTMFILARKKNVLRCKTNNLLEDKRRISLARWDIQLHIKGWLSFVCNGGVENKFITLDGDSDD